MCLFGPTEGAWDRKEYQDARESRGRRKAMQNSGARARRKRTVHLTGRAQAWSCLVPRPVRALSSNVGMRTLAPSSILPRLSRSTGPGCSDHSPSPSLLQVNIP